MQGILYEEGLWPFIMISIVIGGWTAWMTGKGVAESWGKVWPHMVIYTLLLGIGVRFIHHALFFGTMFSAYYYVIDTVILMVFSFLGFRYTRANQMSSKYYWLYEKTGPFGWRLKNAGQGGH
jgi:uncharacterized membrane protein SirB2